MPVTPDAPPRSVHTALARARGLADPDLLSEVFDVEAQIRGLQARRAALIAEVDARIEAAGLPLSGAADTVAVTLVISPRAAEHLLGTAVELCARDVVWAALADGRIDLTKAGHIVTLLSTIPDPRREELELSAIDYATGHTAHELKRHLLRATCADPDESLRKDAHDNRGVWIIPAAHGMADVTAHLPADQAEIFFQAIERMAAAEPADDRTDPQRRADALITLLRLQTQVSINVDVVISADALAAKDTTPGELNGSPVPAAFAAALAWHDDARWTRLVTDPLTGSLIDMGTEAYRIPTRIKNAVNRRDRTCRFPGCHRPAHTTDTDHVVPHPRGSTEPANLAAMCRRHHRIKTHSGWQVTGTPDADLIWTSPLGSSHRTRPHDYRE